MDNLAVIDAIYSQFVASNYQVSTDTRTIEPGSIFFCIRGDKFDGNAFAADAKKQGASMVVVDHPSLKDHKDFVWVEDTTVALQQLSKIHALKMPCQKIMVGGSNGKTTTKEVSRVVLELQGEVLATPGNWNNHIGVPLTLLQLRPHHKYAIIEMGTNHPGEMKVLCDLLSPNTGIITNIGKEHLEGFGNIEEVAKEESEVYLSVINHNGIAVVNADDPWLLSMSKRIGNQITISTNKMEADFYAQIETEMPELTFQLFNKQRLIGRFTSQLSGRYNAYNLLFGVALGHQMGLNIHEAMSAACTYKPTNNRSEWRMVGGTNVFLDAYNANPSSMKFALESFSTLKGEKLYFLGDMLELGDHSELEHQEILSLCESLNIIDQTYLVGSEFYNACASHPLRFETIDSLLAWLDTHPIKSEFAFVKGSRGVRMERVLEHFDKK
jgi:UDP-N-acetylmuramoyl-tripeptide--D-alanyl-D-alanine ligase